MKTVTTVINGTRIILGISIMVGAFWYAGNTFAAAKASTEKETIKSLRKECIANIPKIRKKLRHEANSSVADMHEGLLIGALSHREVVGLINNSSLMRDITKEKIALFKKAASQGDYIAQNNLGVVLYKEGKIKEAKQLFEKSIKKDYAPAQYNLGKILEKEGKKQEATKLFLKSAKQGLLQSVLHESHLFRKSAKYQSGKN